VLPDLDGAGIVPDLINPMLGIAPTTFYATYHHVLLHGLAGALTLASLLTIGARRKARVFWMCLVTIHLHLLCDLVGSRGPDPDDFWPITYLPSVTWLWKGQWRLDGWQNVTLTLVLLAYVFHRAWRWNRSPLQLLSLRLHDGFVQALRARFKRI
jgi:inner membrane protein